MTLPDLLQLFLSLGGVALFVAALVAALRFFGVANDSNESAIVLLLNGLGFFLFVIANIAGFDVTPIDALLGSFAGVITAILALLGQIAGTRFALFSGRAIRSVR